MIPRRALGLSIALLPAAAALAQKPSPEGLDPVAAHYRDRALAACVSDLNAADDAGPEASESVCGCAVRRFMSRWPSGALPPLEGGHVPMAMSTEILPCASQENPALAAAIARRIARAAVTAPPVAPERPDKPRMVPETERGGSKGFDPGSWFEGLSLPRWLTESGLPIWAWIPLVLGVFLFLRGLFRGSGDTDLLGPSARTRPSRPPTLPRGP